MRVAHFAARLHLSAERVGRELLQSAAHLGGERESEVWLRLDARVALAMVVVHFVGIEREQETREGIQAVTVGPADGSVEDNRDFARKNFGGERTQQILTLRENLHRCVQNAFSVTGIAFSHAVELNGQQTR